LDTQRLILFMLFAFSVFFLMDAWQKETQPARVGAPAAPPVSGPAGAPVPAPSQPLSKPHAQPAAGTPVGGGDLQKGETIRVQTDESIADIDTEGGDLRRLEFLELHEPSYTQQ